MEIPTLHYVLTMNTLWVQFRKSQPCRCNNGKWRVSHFATHTPGQSSCPGCEIGIIADLHGLKILSELFSK